MNVTWILPDGREISATIAAGTNLMEAAVSHNVPGVLGECGGNLSCATCHVYVQSAAALPAMEDFEDAMLDAVEAPRTVQSRLSCQIIADPALDGLVLKVPGEGGSA
ncbi:MAG: 2Fe-2S iron-sulfur cluster-binding protein [Lutimaribacter sp.]